MGPRISRDLPFNALPLLPPEADVETKPVLKAVIRARTALADLKGAGRLVPNPAVLVRALALQEARQSSEIENIVTTNDDLYQAMSLEAGGSDTRTKEVLRYSDALWLGIDHLAKGAKIDTGLFCHLCSVILEKQMDVRDRPGTRISNALTREVVYTPPEGVARLRGLLDNLSDYLADEGDTDPLIKLAVAHYQFEAIHPFTDGNGRTGRVVNIMYLVQQGLLEHPVLYLSRFVNENKRTYYSRLRAVTEETDWEPWIGFMLEAVEETAIETRARIIQIREAMDKTAETVRLKLPKIYSRELVETVFSQPYCRVAFLVQAGLAQRQTASKYLDALASIGVLQKTQVWRDNLYLNPELLRILTV